MIYLYILALSLFMPAGDHTGRRDCADLEVKEFVKPEFDPQTRTTRIKVIVENRGKMMSDTTRITLTDLEIPDYSDELSSKPSIAMYGEKPSYERMREDTLLPMQPGEVREFNFEFDYWVYDPDCELELVLDPDNKLEECRKDNNVYRLLERQGE